jgi:hypothetical protein
MTAMMRNQQGSGSAYYGAVPTAIDSTALDEIALYSDLLQAVAAHPTAGKRLDWAVIDQALGLPPGKGGPGVRPGTRRPGGGPGESAA